MQVPSGYGSHHQNYVAPSGHYPPGPGKMSTLPLDGQCNDYYSGLYTLTPQPVGPLSPASHAGAQQVYSRGPPAPPVLAAPPGPLQGPAPAASHVHTSASQPYPSFVNYYSSPAIYTANSSTASQGFPPTCGHYAVSTVSNAVHPSVSYPSLPTGDPPYAQAFTSQSALATSGPAKEASFPGQNTAQSRASALAPPPSQQHHQQQSLSGYSAPSWSTPGLPPALPPAQDALFRNHTGPLVSASNSPANTGRLTEEVPKTWLRISAKPVPVYVKVKDSKA